MDNKCFTKILNVSSFIAQRILIHSYGSAEFFVRSSKIYGHKPFCATWLGNELNLVFFRKYLAVTCLVSGVIKKIKQIMLKNLLIKHTVAPKGVSCEFLLINIRPAFSECNTKCSANGSIKFCSHFYNPQFICNLFDHF